MRLFITIKLILLLSISLTHQAHAQSTLSNPTVMDAIGDVGSESARKKLFKSIKKKPNAAACKAGEWEKLGFRHAYEYQSGGKDYDDRWEMVQKKCTKANVKVDKIRYDAGYLEGSILHCGYERGIMYGYYYSGKKSGALCEQIDTPSYDKGFADGEVISLINDERLDLRERYDQIQAEYTKYNDYINGQASTEEEQSILDEISEIRDELRAQLTLYEKVYRDMRVSYHLSDIYTRRLPDKELRYKIPASPKPLN